MLAIPLRASISDLAIGVLDTGAASFFDSAKLGAEGVATGFGWWLAGGTKGFGGSSSLRLFHMRAPS
jgi:hypothetical protein